MLHNVETIAAFTPPPALLTPSVNWQRGESARLARMPRIGSSPAAPTTETRLISPAPNPETQYVAQHAAKHFAHRQLYMEIEARIRELITDALSADEPFSWESLSDLLLFTSQIPFARRPAIFLLDNGNFRAVWKNPQNEQAAFQFRGRGIVHCVFFYKRKAPQLPLSQ